MSIETVDLRTNRRLPPTMECGKRIGEVIGLKVMRATYNTMDPLRGGMAGRYGGHQYMITWRPVWRTNTRDRSRVACMMFEAKADWMNLNCEWVIPMADFLNEQERSRFAQGLGNRMLDGIARHESGAADPSQAGSWSEDLDIKQEHVEKAIEKLKKDEEAEGA